MPPDSWQEKTALVRDGKGMYNEEKESGAAL
jgi:hypothetical protein